MKKEEVSAQRWERWQDRPTKRSKQPPQNASPSDYRHALKGKNKKSQQRNRRWREGNGHLINFINTVIEAKKSQSVSSATKGRGLRKESINVKRKQQSSPNRKENKLRGKKEQSPGDPRGFQQKI